MPRYPIDRNFGYIRDANIGFGPYTFCTKDTPDQTADMPEGAVFNENGDTCPACGLVMKQEW